MTEEKKKELQKLAVEVWDNQIETNNAPPPKHLMDKIDANSNEEHMYFIGLLANARKVYFEKIGNAKRN